MGWGGQDVRTVDDFYKGGETIRGFAPSGLGARDQAHQEPSAARPSRLDRGGPVPASLRAG